MKKRTVIKIGIREIKKVISECLKEILSEQKKSKQPFDLKKYFDSIPTKKLRVQYYDLSMFRNIGGYGDRFMFTDNGILKEENETTLSPAETMATMRKQFGFREWQMQEIDGANGITLILLCPKLSDNEQTVIDGMAACGWSVGTSEVMIRDNMIWRSMTFEPMQQEMVTDIIRLHYRYLYHWTLLSNYRSIMDNGLEARSENGIFRYPERVHFFADISNGLKAISIGEMLYKTNKSPRNNGRYVLLSIDLSKLPNLPLYHDPRLSGGVYAKETIPSFAIGVVIGYDFKNNQAISL